MTVNPASARLVARNLYPALSRSPASEDWQAAIRLRHAAFHEAGHLWAAHLMRLVIPDVALTETPEPIEVALSRGRAKFAAAGLLASCAMPLADSALQTHGLVDEHTVSAGAAVDRLDEVDRCQRSVDSDAFWLIDDRGSAIAWLLPLLDDWPRIHAIAMALIDRSQVGDNEVRDIMTRSVHTSEYRDKLWLDDQGHWHERPIDG